MEVKPPRKRSIPAGLISLAVVSGAAMLVVMGCRKAKGLSDFSSDGCSLFPDRSMITEEDWCDCCFAHDIAYWKGGTEAERLAADQALRDCILRKTGNEDLAEIMFTGVRMGGSPYFYNWYRWGYGWNFDRKYQPLTEDEKAMAAARLQSFYENSGTNPCDRNP